MPAEAVSAARYGVCGHRGKAHDMKRSGNSQEDSDKVIMRRELEYYRGLLEWLEGWIVGIDSEGLFTFVNDAYCRKVGKGRDELIAEPFMPLVREEDLPAVRKVMEELKRPPYRTTMMQRARTAEGHRWIEWQACAIRNDAGEIVEIQGVGRDLTELRQSVEELHKSESRMAGILSSLKESAIVLFSRDGCVEAAWTDPQIERRYGVRLDEIIGRNVMDVSTPFEGDRTLGRIRRVFETGGSVTFERRMRLPNGEGWFHVTYSPIRDDDGNVVSVAAFARDVTRRRQAVQALRESEQAERDFRRRLEALHEINVELTKADSLRDLFRSSIELGRDLLGFDRLSVWLKADGPGVFVGTFGTDEEGAVRDEWGARIMSSKDNLVEEVISGRIPVGMRWDEPILDHRLRKVGTGQHAVAPLWDGQRIIGYVSTDNLLRGEPLTEDRLELLRLFASTVGHLCTRKRAEEALRDSEEAERRFREQLQELHGVNAELTKVGSLRELFRRAVRLGRRRLGFDRLSIWLGTDEPDCFIGTFGVDEQGNLRNEWGTRTLTPANSVTGDALRHRAPLCRENVPVFDDKGRTVGIATQAIAPLWDGREVIGFVATDNLISREPITDSRMELLRLFATSVGHLCTRERAEQELRKLHRQLISAREAERKRIAQELHDSLGQRIVFLHLSFKNALAELGNCPDGEALATLRQVADECGRLVQDVRNLSHALYPSTLEELGLYAAVEQLVSDHQAEAKVTIRCPERLRNARFSSTVETELFRIAQEALSNALRHSQAKQIDVSLDHRKGELVLAVQDDGVGLDPTRTGGEGMGLSTMRERTEAVEGTLRIQSKPGRTRIEARVPAERVKTPASGRRGPRKHTGRKHPRNVER